MKDPEGAEIRVNFEYPYTDSQQGKHEKSSLKDCVTIVANAALDSDRVLLVVTGDFDQSVRDRFPADIRHLYSSARGDGEVGAKVMAVGKHIHVIVPEYYFSPNPDPSFDYALRNRYITRIVRHEAGHVTMEQAGEASGPTIDREGVARGRLLHIADEAISEYRAELDVALEHRIDVDGFRPEATASWLRNTLTEISIVSYQAHLDTGRLANDVAEALKIATKQLAPNAADRRLRGLAPDDAFDDATANDVDWQLLIEPVWASFAEALVGMPPASERVSQGDLDRATSRLADVLNSWLLRLNFDWSDSARSFRITSFALYE